MKAAGRNRAQGLNAMSFCQHPLSPSRAWLITLSCFHAGPRSLRGWLDLHQTSAPAVAESLRLINVQGYPEGSAAVAGAYGKRQAAPQTRCARKLGCGVSAAMRPGAGSAWPLVTMRAHLCTAKAKHLPRI